MYAIHVRQSYYEGTCNAPQSGVMRDMSGAVIALLNREDAQRVIDAIEPRGVYHLSHGEYAQPSYRVVGYSGSAPRCSVIEAIMYGAGIPEHEADARLADLAAQAQ